MYKVIISIAIFAIFISLPAIYESRLKHIASVCQEGC